MFSPPSSSHSLSGRAIFEGPVQHNSAPAEASSSSGYNSEWISISSGCFMRMRNCVLVSPCATFQWCHSCAMASSTALSCVGGVLACSPAVFALPASHTGVWVCSGKLSWDPDLYFYSQCEKQFKFKDAKRSVWAISWNGVGLGVFLFGFLFVFFCHTDIGTVANWFLFF